MGLLDTLANILTREPKAKPEYGPMSDALAEQAKGYGVTGGLLNAIDPYILDPMNAPERRWVRQNLAAKSAKDMVAPSADAMERIGMAGIFAGPNAKTANLVALKEAENLAAKGADNEAIRQATGWFKGMGDKWMYEIDDSTSRLHPMVERGDVRKWDYSDGIPLSDAIVHPQLLAAYPELGTLRTAGEIDQLRALASEKGGYGNGKLLFRGGDVGEAREVLLHELQHPIQRIEGFPNGGSPAEFGKEVANARYQRDRLSDIIKRNENAFSDEARALLEDNPKKANRILNWLKKEDLYSPEVEPYQNVAFGLAEKDRHHQGLVNNWRSYSAAAKRSPTESYNNLAGEIQARDVSARMNLTPEQRMATPPDLRSDAIVRYGNGPQMSVPGYVEDAATREANFKKWLGNDTYLGKWLHGTDNPQINEFKSKRGGGEISVFAAPKTADGAALADDFAYTRAESMTPPEIGQTKAASVYPLHVKANKVFNADNPEHLLELRKKMGADFDPSRLRDASDWLEMERPYYIKAMKDLGYDAMYVRELGPSPTNIAVFKPENAKSIFNRGTYDPTDPNILKSLIPAAATAYGIEEVLPYD